MTLLKRLRRIRLPSIPIRSWIRDHRVGLARAGRVGLAVGGLALVVLLVHREVYSLVVTRPEHVVTPDSLRVALAPKWARGQHAVEVDVGKESWSIYDDEAVARVGRAFERNPWVRRVTAVERVFPNRLRVRYEYRTPYATVRNSEGWILVDRERVRLPGVWKERPPCVLDVDLTGVGSAPLAGQAWDHPALAAAIELAELVEREPLLVKAGVRVVDVSNLGGKLNPKKSELALLTECGCVIYWGRRDSARSFGELTVAQKVENLKRVLDLYRKLDGLQYVKVYFEKPYWIEKDDRTTDRRR